MVRTRKSEGIFAAVLMVVDKNEGVTQSVKLIRRRERKLLGSLRKKMNDEGNDGGTARLLSW